MVDLNEDPFGEFAWANVRLATYFSESSVQPRLLFGLVSLLTKDRPKPPGSTGIDSHKVGRGKHGKVFFKRTVLSASEAISWYRNAGEQNISTPIPTDSGEVDRAVDGISLAPTSFEDDPQWPSLGIPLNQDELSNVGRIGDPAPFRGPGAPRIHRRFGDDSGFDAIINDESAIKFLKRRLHLNLSDYTEYLGALALIIPDPILLRVHQFMTPSKAPDDVERLYYRLVPRPGKRVDELSLTIIERRSNLLSRFEPHSVPADGIVSVTSAKPFDRAGYVISHPAQGVVSYHQPLPFIRTVNFSINSAHRRVKVKVPSTESPRSRIDSYEITEYESAHPFTIGQERDDPITKVAKAEHRRRRRAAAKRYNQTWFDDGQRDKAIAFLRQQLGRARLSVIIADPYFGALQIGQFLHAVPNTRVNFTILTSRLAFESQFADTGDKGQDGSQDGGNRSSNTIAERLTCFSQALETLRSRGMSSVSAMVLSGKSPPLHDRFLAIDDEVLFLGNSLNALGDRASLILSIPDSEPVLEQILAMARLAVPFESYASERQDDTSPIVED
ncbi:MAG: hypothetical protein JJ855_10950 [Rhodospirillales bacterium]|nr:hypothetical protein [Rhodospirillales bacterium]